MRLKSAWRKELQSDPLFRKNPEILFSANGHNFAKGTIGDFASEVDFLGDHGLSVTNVPIRDYLLAKAFPSSTRPMGSTQNSKWDSLYMNFNMSDLYMTDPNNWARDKTYNDKKLWYHSDILTVPYVHVWKFYAEITGKQYDEKK